MKIRNALGRGGEGVMYLRKGASCERYGRLSHVKCIPTCFDADLCSRTGFRMFLSSSTSHSLGHEFLFLFGGHHSEAHAHVADADEADFGAELADI